MKRNARRLSTTVALALGLVCVTARPALPAEISAFASGASPGETWSRGYGGMLTISLFNLVYGELEAARQGSDLAGTSLLTGSAKAYVGPTIGALVPYAGLGAGVYHEGLPGDDDSGTYGALFLGVKLKFPVGLVLRGEYQRLKLPEAAPLKLDNRVLVAVGLHI